MSLDQSVPAIRQSLQRWEDDGGPHVPTAKGDALPGGPASESDEPTSPMPAATDDEPTSPMPAATDDEPTSPMPAAKKGEPTSRMPAAKDDDPTPLLKGVAQSFAVVPHGEQTSGRERRGGPQSVCFLGSYSPRRCGIATFTDDLQAAVLGVDPSRTCSVLAMNDPNRTHAYPSEVVGTIEQNELVGYHRAADILNAGSAELVCVQHEYGIFGGVAGGFVLALLRRLQVPIVTTLHTILPAPSAAQRAVMRELCDLSERVVVMSASSADTLHRVHQVPMAKIDIIPHGAPAPEDRSRSKAALGLDGRPTLLTFGLLSPDKGIEYVIEALPTIAERYPRVAYAVVGATHPHVRAEHGESYRRSLEAKARALGVAENIIFDDRFVSPAELASYLCATDLYLTPYPSTEQSTSGTLARAVAAGKAVISSPYPYAQELLADGRGVLVPPRDPVAIADAVLDLLGNHRKRASIEREALALGSGMSWDSVGRRYLSSFRRAARSHEARLRSLPEETPAPSKLPPRIDLSHLRAMTDGTGLLQHATFNVPRYRDGYCLDDNARALLLLAQRDASRHHRLQSRGLAASYLAFVDHAFDPLTGRFRNFMSYSRQWLEATGSEDSHGRAVWALGTVAGGPYPSGHRALARLLFEQALPATLSFDSPRAWAYTLLGLEARRSPGARPSRTEGKIRSELAQRLFTLFANASSDSWPWGEDKLTYCNARLPQALIASGVRLRNRAMVAAGLRSLRWLDQVQTGPSGMFTPVGSNGFYPSDGEKAEFDQQPVEACGMVSACLLAHRTTGDKAWLQRAMLAFDWFLGRNQLGRALYDERTGGCRDGIHSDRLNENQGAESTLSFLMALVEVRRAMQRAPAAARVSSVPARAATAAS